MSDIAGEIIDKILNGLGTLRRERHSSAGLDRWAGRSERRAKRFERRAKRARTDKRRDRLLNLAEGHRDDAKQLLKQATRMRAVENAQGV